MSNSDIFRPLGVAGVVIVTLLMSALSAPVDARPGDRAAIDELLRSRAEAYAARDESAFMSTVSADSLRFRKRQRRFLSWSEPVPFASYELEADWDRFGDLSRPADLKRYPGAEDVVIAMVEERYRIEGFDPNPAVEEYFFTFVKRAGEWLIAEDTDLDSLGLHSVRHLWDFGPVVMERQPHFSLLRHPCGEGLACVRLPNDFFRTAEEALAQVDRLWSVPWRHEILLYVPASTAELGRMIQATFELDNFVAFAYATYEAGDGYDLTGYRVMLNWHQISGRDDDSLRTILAHELLHVATRGVTGPFIPTFIEEGIAEHVARAGDPDRLGFLRAEVAAGHFDAKLPRDFEFLTGDGADIFRSYQEALSAVDFFVDRYSRQRFVRLYRRLGRIENAPGTPTYHLGRALKATVGLGYRRFERAWADSITT